MNVHHGAALLWGSPIIQIQIQSLCHGIAAQGRHSETPRPGFMKGLVKYRFFSSSAMNTSPTVVALQPRVRDFTPFCVFTEEVGRMSSCYVRPGDYEICFLAATAVDTLALSDKYMLISVQDCLFIFVDKIRWRIANYRDI
jgi:hypothetical protein